MDQSVIAVVLAASLLALEGLWFLRRSVQSHHHHAWGLLMLVCAGGALLWARLFYLGRLVVSPELGVVLVQGGGLTRLGMILFLTGVSLGAGLAWSACHGHPREKHLQCLAWRLGLASCVAVLAAFRLQLIGLEEPELPPIHSYDLWSPPLLLWLCFCLAGCVLGLLRVRSLESFFGLAAFLVSVLALLSLGRAEFSESQFAQEMHRAWVICLTLALPTSVGLWSSLLLRRLRRRWPRLREGGHVALAGAACSLGAGIVALSLRGEGAHPWPSWVALVGMLAVALSAAVRRIRSVSLPGLSLPCRRIVLFSLLTLPWVIALPLFSSEVEMLFGLTGVLLIATVLAETLLMGPLHQGLRAWRSQGAEGSGWGPSVLLRGWLARGGGYLKHGYAWLSAHKPLRLLLATIPLTLVLLIAATELPNAGKTIIQPFRVVGLSTPQDSQWEQELGQTLPESLTSAFGDIQHVLQSDVVLQQAGVTKQTAQFNYASDASGASAASAENQVLDIGGGIKVPLHMLFSFIQVPLRALLHVTVIQGTLYEEQTRYVLLARSSAGEDWRIELKKEELSRELSRGEPKLADAVSQLTRRLAFEILSEDPRLADAGITRLPEAFDSFRQGVESWERFARTEDYGDLDQAIARFREATQADPGFAQAYYSLGLALLKDGQTHKARLAFRTSTELNPRFFPAQMALASASSLSGVAGFVQRTTVATPPLGKQSEGEGDVVPGTARQLWWRIIQLPDHQLEKTQAYYGLCSLGFDEAEAGRGSLPVRSISQQRLQAYFYCKRSERVYGHLPAALHASPAIRESGALVQGMLGKLLEIPQEAGPQEACPLWDGEQPPPQASQPWQKRPRLPHYRAARDYYRRAAELSEETMQKVSFQCGEARAAYVLGDKVPMEELGRVPGAHVLRADMYGDTVWELAWYSKDRESEIAKAYNGALMEYEQAINLEPTNVEALIRYAYNFWEWRFRYPKEAPPIGPDLALGKKAEQYARQASFLSSEKESRMRGALALSALGEVLLGQARPDEAIPVLEQVDHTASKNAVFDEFRWDLAQAYLCQAARLEQDGSDEEPIRALRRKARSLLVRIHQHDQEREDKIFANGQPQTGPAAVCLRWAVSGSSPGRKKA